MPGTEIALVEPVSLGHQPAKHRSISAAPPVVACAKTTDWPWSRLSSSASSPAFASMRSAIRHSSRARAAGVIPAQSGSTNAAVAAATAASTSAGFASTAVPRTSPVAGSRVSNVVEPLPWVQSPAISSRVCVATRDRLSGEAEHAAYVAVLAHVLVPVVDQLEGVRAGDEL